MRSCAVALLALLPALLPAPARAAEVLLLEFLCRGNQPLPVAHVLDGDAPGHAVIWYDGALQVLPQAPAASGIAYDDPASGLIWREKGVEGHLARRLPGGGEEDLMFDCRLAGWGGRPPARTVRHRKTQEAPPFPAGPATFSAIASQAFASRIFSAAALS